MEKEIFGVELWRELEQLLQLLQQVISESDCGSVFYVT
jgi:hypothetical protein